MCSIHRIKVVVTVGRNNFFCARTRIVIDYFIEWELESQTHNFRGASSGSRLK